MRRTDERTLNDCEMQHNAACLVIARRATSESWAFYETVKPDFGKQPCHSMSL